MIEEKFIPPLFEDAARIATDYLIKRGKLSHFDKDSHEVVAALLRGVDLYKIFEVESEKQFDEYYFDFVPKLHERIVHYYEDDVYVAVFRQYPDTANLLNAYLRAAVSACKVYIPSETILNIIQLQHPVMSQEFLNLMITGIKSTEGITDQTTYKLVLDEYRQIVESETDKYDELVVPLMKKLNI
ncbi:hypothetical protein ACKGJO_05225 [Gracilimonas sp. Q87]|uniref:hypothetical protein n=1 Tax=Gracilimonas sp. Q87 TaxID=3384766 RepID=UPI003983EF26